MKNLISITILSILLLLVVEGMGVANRVLQMAG